MVCRGGERISQEALLIGRSVARRKTTKETIYTRQTTPLL
jgi:hypothetical protein